MACEVFGLRVKSPRQSLGSVEVASVHRSIANILEDSSEDNSENMLEVQAGHMPGVRTLVDIVVIWESLVSSVTLGKLVYSRLGQVTSRH